MPTRKQQRRRAKTFRHDIVLVDVDDQGNEVTVDPKELRAAKEKDAPAKTKGKGAKGQAAGRRAPREVQPPSWNRSLRRSLPMGAVMMAIVFLLPKVVPLAVGVIYAIAFIPLSYAIDRYAYTRQQKRLGKT